MTCYSRTFEAFMGHTGYTTKLFLQEKGEKTSCWLGEHAFKFLYGNKLPCTPGTSFKYMPEDSQLNMKTFLVYSTLRLHCYR